MRKMRWLKEEGTHPLCRVILHLELDASALACYQYASEDTGLYPDLATFTDNKTLRRGPRVKTEAIPFVPGGIDVARVALPVLVLPGDANRGAELVSYPEKPISEIDGRRGGV
jgi:hypothetical protein